MNHHHPNFSYSLFLVLVIFIIQTVTAILFGLIERFNDIIFYDEVAVYIALFPYVLLLFIFLKNDVGSVKSAITKQFSIFLLIPVVMLSIGLYILLGEFDSMFKFIIPIPDLILKWFRYNTNFNDLSIGGMVLPANHPETALAMISRAG